MADKEERILVLTTHNKDGECESRGPCKETKRKAIEAWNRRKPNGV